jgi:Bacteriophage baseplate protein W
MSVGMERPDERDSPAFVGRGWSYPVGVNHVGGIGTADGVDNVEQAIYVVLATAPGERPMRPEFGCPLVDYMFAPLEPATYGRVAADVEQALRRWEPRIDLHGVTVGADPDQDGTLLIEVSYSLRHSYDRRNLVFPFYVIPEHRE